MHLRIHGDSAATGEAGQKQIGLRVPDQETQGLFSSLSLTLLLWPEAMAAAAV